jgi:hypothetical protein
VAAGALTPVQAELQERLRYDTPFWAGGVTKDETGAWREPGPGSQYRGCAKILSKEKRLVPLIAHPWQLRLDVALEVQRAAGLPMRVIIVKARKLGFSTWIAAKFMQRLTQIAFQNAVVVAQDVKTAGVLFDMARLIHTNLPTQQQLGLPFGIRPDIVSRSFSPTGRKFLRFGQKGVDDGTESMLEIDTAGTAEAGRGYTPSLVHGSEVAHWPENGKLLGLLNAVPDALETIVALESTANGFNHFHKRWIRAMEGEEDPELGGTYVPIFAAWHEDPDCSRAFLSPEARERFVASIGTGPYGSEEPDLIDLFGCTPEQLYWRRGTIRDRCDDSIEKFHQEYPSTPEEAFIGSGASVFSGILVARAIVAAEAAPEPVRGVLEGIDWVERKTRGGTVLLPRGAVWVPEAETTRRDLMDVWEHPVTEEAEAERPEDERQPVGQYITAADVAQGSVNTFEEGDFHAVTVLDHFSKQQVAQYESRIDIHELPMVILLIALYYNISWLAVEVNGPGIAVVDWLAKEARYRRLHRRRRVDKATNDVEDKIGWITDRATKPVMETTLSAALKEGTHGIRSVRMARQLTTYVEDDKGKHGAMAGAHDDLLVAQMIGQRVADVTKPKPLEKSRSGRRRTVYDDLTGW